MNDRPPMGWAAGLVDECCRHNDECPGPQWGGQPGLVDDNSQSVPTSGNAQQDAGGLWDPDEMIVRPPMGWAART